MRQDAARTSVLVFAMMLGLWGASIAVGAEAMRSDRVTVGRF